MVGRSGVADPGASCLMSRGIKSGIDRFAAKGRETSIRVRQERARRHAADLAPVITELRASGATTLQAIAAGLNERSIPTARGNQWSAVQVSRVIAWTAEQQLARAFPPPVETRPAVDTKRAAEKRQADVTAGPMIVR